MDTSELRTTETKNAVAAKPAPRRFDPTRLLVQRDRLPWFWFFFTVAVLLLSAMDRYHIVSQFKLRERVVIIDPAGTYYLSPLLQFSEAKDLHIQQAELATMAFLERKSQGFRQSRFAQIVVPQICVGQGAGRARQRDGRVSRQTVATKKPRLPALTFWPTREKRGAGRCHRPDHSQRHFQEKAFTEAFPFNASAPPHPQPQHVPKRTLPNRSRRLQI